MKKQYFKVLALALMLSGSASGFAAAPSVLIGASAAAAPAMAPAATSSLVIDGTGNSANIDVNASNLFEDITITATAGLKVYPTTLPANASGASVKVTLTSTMPETTGQVILRSGDYRVVVNVLGYGSPLAQKDLSATAVSKEEKNGAYTAAQGFTPGENGYTVEVRGQLTGTAGNICLYGVTPEGGSFKAYVKPDAMGFYNGSGEVAYENPLNNPEGGNASFYNKDGKEHTYRFAVTPDKRVFVYRDGVQVAAVRATDYGNQAEWAVENGEVSPNLLKNGNFEGEFNFRRSDSLVNKVEGWFVDPIDRYNCEYNIKNQEIDKEHDQYNHVLWMKRYNWNDGWGAGTVSQIVDVAPNSTYSLSFLAKGGQNINSKDVVDTNSKVIVSEVQNSNNNTEVEVTSQSAFQQYGLDYTTSADCKQLKVTIYNERFLNGNGWGSSPVALLIDDMVLTGKARTLDQSVGFSSSNSKVAYFAFDATGAYAPVEPVLEPETAALTIDGVGNHKDVAISIANLVDTDPIQVSATAGFSVFPTTLRPNADGKVRITLNSSLPETAGKLILRSGDLRKYIDLTGYAGEFETRDLKETAVSTDNAKAFEATAADGFTAGKNGYTIEFRAKLRNSTANLDLYGVTRDGASFKAYVAPEAMGFYNGASQISFENPATDGEGGNKQFYNKDGNAHTYRYTVAPDGRVFVYRDNLLVATRRSADFAHQADWAVENGSVSENLLQNPGFEGEWNLRSDGLLNQVEGWIVDPIDQYNCNYNIVSKEINNSLDYNNHVLKMQRYNWNDGWGAGTVSQIVDVVPESTYSLSFLAMGGQNINRSGELDTNSRVILSEVRNASNKAEVEVTSKSDFKEYGLSYTTSADCKQLKVTIHNERFLNGGGWGSSPVALHIDQLALVGQGRVLDQKVGYKATNTTVEYFAYDPTGAYAPPAPGMGFDGIESVETSATAAYAKAAANGVAIYNTEDAASVAIYDLQGKAVAYVADYAAGATILLPARGMYVAVISGTKVETIKVVY